MRSMSKMLLAGLGACALAGTAYAADRELHRMNVALPDGSVAHVTYQGDVAPKVEVVPVDRAIPVVFASPFVGFDQMFADMDRQAAALMQQARALQAQMPANGAVDQAALKSLPAGSSYTFTSYSSSNGGCTQSYQMTSYGNGAAPKVVSQTSGDCSKAGQLQAAPKPAKAVEAPKVVPHDAA